MKVDSSTCPKCGAPLKVQRGLTEITCTYCGNVSLVQQGRGPVVQPFNAPPMMVVRIPPPRPPAALWIVPAVIGMSVAMVAVLVSVRRPSASRSVSGGPLGIGAAKEDRLSFDDAPMLADANGDGTPDVIGHSSTYSSEGKETHFLAAYDGATGKQLWRSTPAPKETFGGKRALAGGYVINVDELGKVQAFRVSNGTPAWSALLGEKARWFCADKDSVIIEADDESYTRFDLATGKKGAPPPTSGRRARPACASVYQSPHIEETPTTRLIGWSDFSSYGLPELHATPGMSAHRALVPTDQKGGTSFLLGSKDKGTSVAMIAAVEGGTVKWKDVVPGVDPLTTDVNVTTILAAAGGGRVVVPYSYKHGKDGVRMACFDAKSGVRVWDTEVHTASDVETGITIEGGRVYYASWTALYVLSLADGKRAFMVGHDF